MNRILSEEEMEMLRASAKAIGSRHGAADMAGGREVFAYDFRHPDRVSKEQIRSLHFLHERFTRKLSSSLAAYLRASVEVSTTSIDQLTYGEFLMGLPDPTVFFSVGLPPIEGLGALEMSPSLAFAVIDRMLGGAGRQGSLPAARPLTEIEQHVIDAVMHVIIDNLTDSWRPVREVDFQIQAREAHPQMLQVAPPNEPVLVLVFEVRVAEAKGLLNLCLPAAAAAIFDHGFAGTRREPTSAESERLWRSLSRIQVGLGVTIETRMTSREILDLAPGDLLSLGHPVREPLEVRAGRIVKYLAEPVVTDHGAGLAILAPVTDRAAEGHR